MVMPIMIIGMAKDSTKNYYPTTNRCTNSKKEFHSSRTPP